jgi:hypothetical protein
MERFEELTGRTVPRVNRFDLERALGGIPVDESALATGDEPPRRILRKGDAVPEPRHRRAGAKSLFVKGPESLDFAPDFLDIGNYIRFGVPAHDAM